MVKNPIVDVLPQMSRPPECRFTANMPYAPEALSSYCRWLREHISDMPPGKDRRESQERHDIVHAKMIEMYEWRRHRAALLTEAGGRLSSSSGRNRLPSPLSEE